MAISAAKRQGLRELIHSAEEILMTAEPFLKEYSLPPQEEVTPFTEAAPAADEPGELVNSSHPHRGPARIRVEAALRGRPAFQHQRPGGKATQHRQRSV